MHSALEYTLTSPVALFGLKSVLWMKQAKKKSTTSLNLVNHVIIGTLLGIQFLLLNGSTRMLN